MFSPTASPSKIKVKTPFSFCGDTGTFTMPPVLEPGQAHQDVSGCNLKSGIGKMVGTYLMERIVDGTRVEVNIPEFSMIAPLRLN
jgi:ApaG protein